MFGKFDDSAWGTMWKKLVRKDAPITSIEAAEAIDTTRLERVVYEGHCIVSKWVHSRSSFG
jgi:hypothetical protein